MLVLKLARGERVSFFDPKGQEMGKVGFDNTGCGPNTVRLVIDFEKDVQIYRDSVIEKSPQLQANLTFRKS